MNATIFTAVFMPLALAVIMFGMGLSLAPLHFRQLVTAPRAMALGFGLQMVMLPLLAFGVAMVMRLPPELAVGLVLIAACPGGPTSNLFAHLARGDTALAIALTAFSSLAVIVTLPWVVNLALGHFMGTESHIVLSIWDTIQQLTLITLVPVALGMTFRAWRPAWALAAERPVKILSACFLALVIAGVLLGIRDDLVGFFAAVGGAALLLNLLALLVGFGVAQLCRLGRPRVATLTIEVGLQNGTMGIMVAATLLQQPMMAVPAAIYSLLMFATGTLTVLLLGLRRQPGASTAQAV